MFSKKEIEEIRSEFPFLEHKVNGKSIVYFDNAATTQKPYQILEGLADFYKTSNGNPHRGAHYLSEKSTEIYEGSRARIGRILGTDNPSEIIFVRNTTETLNLLAYSYGMNKLSEGDEILITLLEHHSNMVPWQQVSEKTGSKLVFLYPDEDMQLSIDELKEKVSESTKLVGLTMASNVVGTLPKLKEMIEIIRKQSNAVIVLDGAQYVPHHKVNVKDLDCDFLAFSGHKLFSSMGVGVLYGKEELLNEIPPFLYGGDMIEYVYETHSTFLLSPQRFEAGTQNVEGAKSICDAFDYMDKFGIDSIAEYEAYLTDYCWEQLKQKDYLDVYTTSNKNRTPVVSFNFKEVHPHDVASILDSYGIAVRSGHHCAQPLHRYLGSNFSCRASFAIYNTIEEIDYFVKHLEDVRRVMRVGL